MNTKLIYGRIAYEGFAKAIGLKLGLKVRVEDGASPCIDAAGTVYLPAMNNYQTAAEFERTCGAIVHELAHLFYGSNRMIDPKHTKLQHDCFNAVLDVADETCISHWFGNRLQNARPGYLLDTGNSHALYSRYKDLSNWNNSQSHAWKLLCTGILKARVPKDRYLTRLARFNAAKARYTAHVDARAAWRKINSAKRTKADDGSPRPGRFRRRLVKLAEELYDLLKPLETGEPHGGTGGSGGSPSGSPSNDLEAAIGQGSSTAPPSGTPVANGCDGADLVDGPANGAGGQAGQDPYDSTEASRETYELLHPAAQRIAQRIAVDGEGLSMADGLATGPMIGQAYRLATDGNCLARWQTNEHAEGLSVAILLDCSDSMSYVLGQCAGIARAFALAMRECGVVLSIAFAESCQCRDDDFERVAPMGSTNTDKALKLAREWLAQKTGSKWIVVVTDGQPNCPESTQRECYAAYAERIKILAVGLDCNMAETMPTATVVTAKDPLHLAIELQAAAQMIEQA